MAFLAFTFLRLTDHSWKTSSRNGGVPAEGPVGVDDAQRVEGGVHHLSGAQQVHYHGDAQVTNQNGQRDVERPAGNRTCRQMRGSEHVLLVTPPQHLPLYSQTTADQAGQRSEVRGHPPALGLGARPAACSCWICRTFRLVLEPNRKLREASSKHAKLGTMVSQFRKLRFPLRISATCRPEDAEQEHGGNEENSLQKVQIRVCLFWKDSGKLNTVWTEFGPERTPRTERFL